MIRAVIFDCFGVVIADGLEAVLVRSDQSDPAIRPFVMDIIHRSNRGLLAPSEASRLICEHLGLSVQEWRQRIAAGEIRNPDVIQLIRELRPRYKTGLLSNVGKGSLKQRFAAAELSELFDAVIVSGEVGMAKPDPEIYELTAGRLGVPLRECVFIDDRQPYVDAARRVGMQAILYENFAQLRQELGQLLGRRL